MKIQLKSAAIIMFLYAFAFTACDGNSGGGNTPSGSSSKTLTSFSILNPSSSGTIDESLKTVSITVPYGTDLTQLIAVFSTTGERTTVDDVEQISSTTPNNFTSPVVYTVHAQDSSIVNYTVTVKVAKSSSKAISAFSILGVNGTIDETAKTIHVSLPYISSVTALVATFSTTGSSVNVGGTVQSSGTTANNFTGSVVYRVTAADDSYADYTVTVTVASDSACEITAFSILGVAGTINESAKTINLTVPNNTDVTNLVATFTTTGASVNVGGTVQSSGITANNFTGPVVYRVTAADTSYTDYNVTVTKASVQFVVSGTGGTAGNKQSFTQGSLVFNMIYVPGGVFPTGKGTQSTAGSGAVDATVSIPYWLAETETSYELWSAVYNWAVENGYTFSRAGVQGHGTGVTNQHPVTAISWRDAMVWCNALTEYYNANNVTGPVLDCVYYTDSAYTVPLRISTVNSVDSNSDSILDSSLIDGSEDRPFIKASSAGNTNMTNCTAKGFRLPGSMEWECAARYKNGTIWTPGTYASGATADINNAEATGLVAWYNANSGSSTHVVKDSVNKIPNALGLYNMSGNVFEWCFDWLPGDEGKYRVIRGGGFGYMACFVEVGWVESVGPLSTSGGTGFRLARNQ